MTSPRAIGGSWTRRPPLRASLAGVLLLVSCGSCPEDQGTQLDADHTVASACAASGNRLAVRGSVMNPPHPQVVEAALRDAGTLACTEETEANCWIVEVDGCCGDALLDLSERLDDATVDVVHPDRPCDCNPDWSAASR